MSDEKQNSDRWCQFIRGVPFPASESFSKKNIEDVMDFMPDDDDVIIASYPKTGSTWMEYIVLQIISKGQLFPSLKDVISKIMPQIEVTGIAAISAQVKPRFYKHHLFYEILQKNSKAKCLYIYRNPEDTVVSFYHYIKNIDPYYGFDFNEFFENFLVGNVYLGNYFQHVLSFYKHREEKNLLMVSYEKLHANRRKEILRIASFLNEEYCECLLKNDEILDKILEHTSFDYMKKNLFMTYLSVITGKKQLSAEEEPTKINMFRKGIVGDGKTVLTETQREGLKTAAEEVLKDTPIIDEWYSK